MCSKVSFGRFFRRESNDACKTLKLSINRRPPKEKLIYFSVFFGMHSSMLFFIFDISWKRRCAIFPIILPDFCWNNFSQFSDPVLFLQKRLQKLFQGCFPTVEFCFRGFSIAFHLACFLGVTFSLVCFGAFDFLNNCPKVGINNMWDFSSFAGLFLLLRDSFCCKAWQTPQAKSAFCLDTWFGRVIRRSRLWRRKNAKHLQFKFIWGTPFGLSLIRYTVTLPFQPKKKRNWSQHFHFAPLACRDLSRGLEKRFLNSGPRLLWDNWSFCMDWLLLAQETVPQKLTISNTRYLFYSVH